MKEFKGTPIEVTDTEVRLIQLNGELQTTLQLLKESHSELLESLQEMVELFDNNCPEETTGQSACNQSKSVINKALGL